MPCDQMLREGLDATSLEQGLSFVLAKLGKSPNFLTVVLSVMSNLNQSIIV